MQPERLASEPGANITSSNIAIKTHPTMVINHHIYTFN